METSVFGGVALCMPAWIRVKDKKNGAEEKTKNDNSSLLVRTSEQGVSSHFQTLVNVFLSLFFLLEQISRINEELAMGFVAH